MKCPECHSKARIVRTAKLSEHLRNITKVCSNENCQMTFETQEEFIRVVQPPKNNANAKHPR